MVGTSAAARRCGVGLRGRLRRTRTLPGCLLRTAEADALELLVDEAGLVCDADALEHFLQARAANVEQERWKRGVCTRAAAASGCADAARTSSFFMQRVRVAMVTATPKRMSGSVSSTFVTAFLSSSSDGHSRRICDIVRCARHHGQNAPLAPHCARQSAARGGSAHLRADLQPDGRPLDQRGGRLGGRRRARDGSVRDGAQRAGRVAAAAPRREAAEHRALGSVVELVAVLEPGFRAQARVRAIGVDEHLSRRMIARRAADDRTIGGESESTTGPLKTRSRNANPH